MKPEDSSLWSMRFVCHPSLYYSLLTCFVDETKTKLIVHAAALPDDMFFPETQTSSYTAPAASMSDIADDTVDMSALGSGAHPYSAS